MLLQAGSGATEIFSRGCVMPTPIPIPEVPWAAVSAQAASVMDVFWSLLAIVAGVVLGSFIFRRVRGAIARRM